MPSHKDITDADIHRLGYKQSADPGAVGAGRAWHDTDDDKVYVRNQANSGWVELTGGGGGAPTGAAGGDLSGTYPNPSVVDNSHAHDTTSVTTHSTAHANDHARSHDHATAGDGTALAPATLTIPSTATPAQTAEGSAVWDSDDDRLTVGTGASRKTLMNTDTAVVAAQMPAHTGDVTSSAGSVGLTIANAAVTLAKMANMATARILGRNTAGSGVPEELAIATVMAMNPAIDVQVITASGTWSKPAGARYVWVRVIGGGGGGGGGQATGAGARSGAGGGGAGGYSEKTFAASALGSSESVTVGTGGAGGVGSTPANGTAGNTSSFGTSGTLVQATGGGGGTAGAASSGATNNVGGVGGVGSSGQINSSGDDGGQGSTNLNGVYPGFGGGSSIGGQARAVDVNSAGTAGRAYGGGGAGGCVGVNNATARNGGLGSDGVVIVLSYP